MLTYISGIITGVVAVVIVLFMTDLWALFTEERDAKRRLKDKDYDKWGIG